MVRPIKETPILMGMDAERFVCEMKRVESLSDEIRANNQTKLNDDYQRAISHISICI